MAPHLNLFISYRSTSVPNLVLLSKSAQYVEISQLNRRTINDHFNTTYSDVHFLLRRLRFLTGAYFVDVVFALAASGT